MSNLTDKQLAARNEGYNANRAGDHLLAFCIQARKTLNARLVNPGAENEAAYEAYIMRKIAIRNMDHNELRAALKE